MPRHYFLCVYFSVLLKLMDFDSIYIFHQIWKIFNLPSFNFQIFLIFLSILFSRFPVTRILDLLIFSHRFLRLFIYFSIFSLFIILVAFTDSLLCHLYSAIKLIQWKTFIFNIVILHPKYCNFSFSYF